MTLPLSPTQGVATRDYHGLPTRRIESEHLWLDVLAEAGPRIIRLGLHGSGDNVLAETPDAGWETPRGRYELLGGHRLWFAPENPDMVAVPDSHGLTLKLTDTGAELTGQPDPITGLIRSIAIRLDPRTAAVDLHHQLWNTSHEPIELAPWAITQLPVGGIATLPQPSVTSEHLVRPNRLLVLWPYTSWHDSRLALGDGAYSVRAEHGPPLKIGAFVPGGKVSYSRAGTTLTMGFQPVDGARYADMGCNVEVYADDRFLELEILGPLVRLESGAKVTLDARWELTIAR